MVGPDAFERKFSHQVQVVVELSAPPAFVLVEPCARRNSESSEVVLVCQNPLAAIAHVPMNISGTPYDFRDDQDSTVGPTIRELQPLVFHVVDGIDICE